MVKILSYVAFYFCLCYAFNFLAYALVYSSKSYIFKDFIDKCIVMININIVDLMVVGLPLILENKYFEKC